MCRKGFASGKDNKLSRNEDKNPGTKKTGDDMQVLQLNTGSRFQEDIGIDLNKDDLKGQDIDGDFQYYIPAEKLNKRSLLHAAGNLKPGKEYRGKSSISGNSLKSREPIYFRSGKTSAEVLFSASFDNDIFDYTDYYYTSGIGFEFYHPAVSSFPLTQLLPGLKYSLNYYGLTLVQNLYTPRKLDSLSVQAGDRPFAAYLVLGHSRVSLSPESRRRLQSELSLGIIGPASLGGMAQDLIHNNEPVGWVNQVGNDFVLNYSIRFDQGIYSGNGLELAVIAGGQAGTLFDNIMAGLYFQSGKFNDRYGSVFQTTGHQKPYKKRVRYYFSLDLKNKLIIYDATLQGGMFNHESVYTLEGSRSGDTFSAGRPVSDLD